MTFPYSQQNADSRRRLESLVGGLSDKDLACTTDYGWTVAALLAHLAFWDHRMSVILHALAGSRDLILRRSTPWRSTTR